MDPILKQRSITSIFFALIVLGLIYLDVIGIMILFAVIACGISYEFCKIVTNQRSKAMVSLLLTAILLAASLVIPLSMTFMVNISVFAAFIHLFLISTLYTNNKSGYEDTMPFYTLLYPGLSILGIFHYVYKSEDVNKFIFLAIIVLIWVSDSGAYLVGRKLGEKKLFEKISPKKTWEGAIGAGIFTLLASFIFYRILEIERPFFAWLSIGLVVWILGTYGDLVESSIKRRYQVKDSGTILPGHGGFFDRFDSFIFVAPFIHLILYLYHI